MMKKLSLILLVVFLLASCALPGAVEPTPTIDLNAIRTMAASTALYELTLIASQASPTPAATNTPEPTATPQPTPTVEVQLVPIEAIATNNLTVRSWPGKGGDNLGGIFYNRSLTVLARSANATWYYIEWADSPTGKAWVSAGGVELKNAELTQLPIALENADGSITIAAPVIWKIEGTPLPLPPAPTGPDARPAAVLSFSNVRACPGLGCMIIGNLDFGAQITLTGRTWGNGWAQFEYPSGPNGKGWISREAIQPSTEGFGGLPYFDDFGREVTPEPPTPTLDPNVTPTETATPSPTPPGPLATVTDITTIYAEPNSLSTELGVFNANDKVYITGISINGSWYQVQYPASSEGRAYISQKNIRVLGDMRYLNYFDNNGVFLPTTSP